MISRIIILALLFILAACESGLMVERPDVDYDFIAGAAAGVDMSYASVMDGIYKVEEGGSRFGEHMALKLNGNNISVFGEKNVAFIIMQGGIFTDSLKLAGYWRYAQSAATGSVYLTISRDSGGLDIIERKKNNAITLEGFITDPGGKEIAKLRLKYDRPLRKKDKEFYIIGHRGGGRNSDRLPHSENSLEMIRMAESLGCNAVEIDVQISSDGIPLLFHDREMSNRTTRGEYLIGPVKNYSLHQLQTYCTLVHGEKIPTLEEALETIVSETNLKMAWLDMKDPNAIGSAIAVVRAVRERHPEAAERLKIMFGIPERTQYDKFRSVADHRDIPSICELGPAETREINALAWAPRWTLGIQNALMDEMQNEGRLVFTWTLDMPEFMRDFLTGGDFDGILTNYPTLLAYEFYAGTEDGK